MYHPESNFTNTLGSLLSDSIKALPYQSDLKDAKTGKYLIVNWPLAEHFGLTPEKIENLTVHELVLHEPQCRDSLHARYCDFIEKLDKKVCDTRRIVRSNKDIVFDKEGFVRILNTVKAPILSPTHKQVVAIMSYNTDITDRYDLLSLFKLYQQHYSEQEASQHFLHYLRLRDYFDELPTHDEILALLAEHFRDIHQQVTHLLGMTNSSGKRSVLSKLKGGSLQEISNIVSNRNTEDYI